MAEARWRAVAHYRSEAGMIDVEHHIEEIGELEGLIERGPDWNTLERIEITLARSTGRPTIEEAARG